MLGTAITILHITVCVFLIIIVLLQHGKGADIGAAFGGSSQTVFGAGGAATFLHKLTIAAAVTFMATSIFLSTMASRKATKSIMSDDSTPAATQVAEPPVEKTDASSAPKADTPAAEGAKEAAGSKPTEPTPEKSADKPPKKK